MRSNITVYIHTLRYRICVVLISIFLCGCAVGLTLEPFLRGERIVILLITFAGTYIWCRQAFNFIRIDLRSERLILRDDIFGKKILNKPLGEIKKIKIERTYPKDSKDNYMLYILKTDGRTDRISFKPKYNINFDKRWGESPPTKAHYLSHDYNFVKFESACNAILTEYQKYLEDNKETEDGLSTESAEILESEE